jgi:hemerythrin-like domain-containing protein
MSSTLPGVNQEHHARLSRHVDAMPAAGDLIGRTPPAVLAARMDETCAFLSELLIPHMEAAEQTLYPQLERMLQNRHSMTPMRREHTEIRTLVEELDARRAALRGGRLSVGDSVTLRRLVFRLYAMLKVHLAEEQLYLDIVEHDAAPDAGAALATAMEHAGTQEF